MSELKPETVEFLEWLGETTERDRILALFRTTVVTDEEPPSATWKAATA